MLTTNVSGEVAVHHQGRAKRLDVVIKVRRLMERSLLDFRVVRHHRMLFMANGGLKTCTTFMSNHFNDFKLIKP